MMIAARGISLVLRGKTILDRVDFTAQAGEMTAIVGPNGSGKTSLLRVLTAEEDAEGEVRLNGCAVNRAAATRLASMRGVLPQVSRLAFPFKVIEVVRIGHRAGLYAGDDSLPRRALDAVGLAGFADRFYQELSGGEQQRVQLARVLAQIWQPVVGGEPRWLFLDEPVASLDIGHQLTIMRLARDFVHRGGGVVAVMHDLNLTAMFADRIAIMKGGRMAATGTPVQVLTDATLSEVYGCRLRISTPPAGRTPYVLPQAALVP